MVVRPKWRRWTRSLEVGTRDARHDSGGPRPNLPNEPPGIGPLLQPSSATLSHTTMFAARTVARRLPQRSVRRWAHTTPTLNFNSVTEQDIAHFQNILSASSILSTLSPISTPASELLNFNNDWMNKYHGRSTTVLRPRTTKEVSEIVKYCNERGIAVVPQGGNTGLVGGGVPIKDELVLSLANMTKIRSFDPVSGDSYSRDSHRAL